MDATVMSYKEVQSAATDLFASQAVKAVFVDGQPGVGKTAMGTYIQQALGLANRFIIKPGHHDPIDFQGVPVPDHASHMTYFFPSGDLLPPSNLEGGCLMIWDETSDCPQAVQNLICQAVFEGGLHGYRFPENTYHFLTGNRVSDKSGSQRVVTNSVTESVGSPWSQPQMRYSTTGCRQGGLPPVLAFLKLCGGDPVNPNDRAKDGRRIPTFFNSFDPLDPSQLVKPIFATSRSWEAASKMVHYADANRMDDGRLLSRLAGLISTPVAMKFVPFRSESIHMPDPDAILRGDKIPAPTKQSILWPLTITLVTKVTKGTWKNMDNWLKQKAIGAEFRILAIRMAFDTKAAKLISPDFNATLQEADVKAAMTAR